MILDKILAQKQLDIAAAKNNLSMTDLQRIIASAAETRGFYRALQRGSEAGRTAIIAEVKKGSPSKGIIRADFDPVTIAIEYAAAGATCLSVLTDATFFYGNLEYLQQIAGQVTLPLLRKDFIVDSYQIYEARAHGADAILLIAAALDTEQLCEFYALATELRLDVLLEVHNEEELEKALQTPCPLIGINNRCLKTFVTDLNVSEQLLKKIPSQRLVVSESGIHSREDIERLHCAGARAYLVGESLMRNSDVGSKLRQLLGNTTGDSGAC